MTDDWRDEVALKLAELVALPENWNSYKAARINQETAQRVTVLLEATMGLGTPPPSIVPLSDGGIQLEWHSHGVDLEVEVPLPGRQIEAWIETPRDRLEMGLSFDGDDPWFLRRMLEWWWG